MRMRIFRKGVLSYCVLTSVVDPDPDPQGSALFL
jgi:hypothetical protein